MHPQILGPVYETFANARRVLEEELNSACDNPIVDYETKNVFHGGNFHGDYISLEEDKVKIATVRMAMTAERQLNYLFHDRINGILPTVPEYGNPRTQLRNAGLPVHGHIDDGRVPDTRDAELCPQHPEQQ